MKIVITILIVVLVLYFLFKKLVEMANSYNEKCAEEDRLRKLSEETVHIRRPRKEYPILEKKIRDKFRR